jgi:energy-coupling factor transporter transmembrane protein EcfT
MHLFLSGWYLIMHIWVVLILAWFCAEIYFGRKMLYHSIMPLHQIMCIISFIFLHSRYVMTYGHDLHQKRVYALILMDEEPYFLIPTEVPQQLLQLWHESPTTNVVSPSAIFTKQFASPPVLLSLRSQQHRRTQN